MWLVQGAAIYINIAAPCTTEIHTENQYFTLLVKPRVQPHFLHRLLLLCFSCNPVIPKNKKSPETFPFFGQNPYICISYQIATGYRTFYSLSLIYQPITKKRLFFKKKRENGLSVYYISIVLLTKGGKVDTLLFEFNKMYNH